MKMIAAELEKKVSGLIREAIDEKYSVDFVLSHGVAGEIVSGVDRAGVDFKIAIAASGPTFESYTVPVAECVVAVSVAARREVFPAAEKITEALSGFERLLLKLQLNSEVVDDLSLENFRAAGVRLADAPALESQREEDIFILSRVFTVRGAATI
jgi:hypothetical protein